MPNSTNTNPLTWRHTHRADDIDYGRLLSYASFQTVYFKKQPSWEITYERSRYCEFPSNTTFPKSKPLSEFINRNALIVCIFDDGILDDKNWPWVFEWVTINIDQRWKTQYTPLLCVSRADNALNNILANPEISPLQPLVGGLVTSPQQYAATWQITPHVVELCVDPSSPIPPEQRLPNTLYFITET